MYVYNSSDDSHLPNPSHLLLVCQHLRILPTSIPTSFFLKFLMFGLTKWSLFNSYKLIEKDLK